METYCAKREMLAPILPMMLQLPGSGVGPRVFTRLQSGMKTSMALPRILPAFFIVTGDNIYGHRFQLIHNLGLSSSPTINSAMTTMKNESIREGLPTKGKRRHFNHHLEPLSWLPCDCHRRPTTTI